MILSLIHHLQNRQMFSNASEEDNSDQDESCYVMAADFFKEKEPKTNRHKWLCFFYRYLFTPTAGFHQDRNRLQNACQVKKLIEETEEAVSLSLCHPTTASQQDFCSGH